jgi:nucleoside-diphosphate-sugar epimerase
MKSILVIGGTGFFGKSIADLFIRNGLQKYSIEKVLLFARNIEKFKEEYPELINEKIELIQGDISFCDDLPEVDIIIHAASSYFVEDKTQNIDSKSTNNFNRIIEEKNYTSKIVYCSSGAVYGQQPVSVEAMDEDFPFQDVASLAEHKREYAISKRRSECEINDLGSKGFNVSIARCFSFYGKYLPKDQHFAYGNFIDDAENGRTIHVKAQGLVYRSYMHADDLVHALIRIAFNSNHACPVYNVGSNKAIEIRDLAKSIADEYNVGLNILRVKEFPNIDRYIPDNSKLKSLNKSQNN